MDDMRLHRAIENGDIGKVRCLISNGACLNSRDGDGNTPLHTAIIRGELEMVRALIFHGADLNSRGAGGQTPLHYATHESVAVEILLELISAGADLNLEGGLFDGKAPYTWQL